MNEVEKLEEEIKEAKKKLAALRKRTPATVVKDYSFTDSFGKTVKLSELFGDRKELIVVHNMGTGCPYCTLWADGFNGIHKHIESRAAFVVSSPDEPCKQRAFGNERGWKFRMVSTKGSTFRKDMGYQGADESEPWPGVSVFTKNRDGGISHVSDSGFGPGDNYCVLWDLINPLPEGQGIGMSATTISILERKFSVKTNHKLVIATTILNQVLGFLWYSPLLFLGAWAAAQGKTLAQMTMSDPVPFIFDIAHAITLSYATSWVMNLSGARCPVSGARTGAILAAALAAPALAAHYGFLGIPGTVLAIDAAKEIVSGALIGAVFGLAAMRADSRSTSPAAA